MDSIELENVEETDFEELLQLEHICFPPDEAATPESLRLRLEQARDYFKCVRSSNNSIIGFINGTCTCESRVVHETMTTHDCAGRFLVVHSVSVSPEHRRKRIGLRMLQAYVLQLVSFRRELDGVLLLTKANLLPLYAAAGFEIVGLSPVKHGADHWFEMRFDLLRARMKQLQVDAFCDPNVAFFSGNPAAVVFRHFSPSFMQQLAQENNLAETSFLVQHEASPEDFDLRWFTPGKEIELCGHATLAAAHAIYETRRLSPSKAIRFHTIYSGVLKAQCREGTVELNFPSTPPVLVTLSPAHELLLREALGIEDERKQVLSISRSPYDLIVEISPELYLQLETFSINQTAIQKLGGRGVVVTCAGAKRDRSYFDKYSGTVLADGRFDYLSRGFFPNAGIPEDTVTGSAHCALAPFWRDKFVSGKSSLTARQGLFRPGVLIVRTDLDEEGNDRVFLGGTSKTVLESTILAEPGV